jgi:nucleoside-diphosphate-sugar epimerase
MVVGSGLIAKAFLEYHTNDDIVIFASGVSNSKETSNEQFSKEERLLNSYLEKYGRSKYFIYFSTCSMFDTYFQRGAYTVHKMKMEKSIIKKALNYNIFRLPQVLGRNNKNQLIGFLYNAIKSEKCFDLYNIERNIIDIDDVFLIIKKILKLENNTNQIINIANPNNIKVYDLVKIIEKLLNKKANYCLIQKEGSFKIDITQILSVIEENIIFENDYLENRIKKYYE